MKELKLLVAEEDFKDLKHALIDFNVKKSVKKPNILKIINSTKKVEEVLPWVQHIGGVSAMPP